MKEISLIFCTEMVQAYRAGRKTMTRRVAKLTPELKRMGGDLNKAFIDGKSSDEEYLHVPCVDDPTGKPWDKTVQTLLCPYGTLGENETMLWIREAWYDYGCWNSRWHGLRGNESDGPLKPSYVADNPQIFHDSLGNSWNVAENGQRKERGDPYWRKKPSIYLPRWACRMTMPLTRVRVERVQSINYKDCMAEGLLRYEFAALWEEINGKRAGCKWADNPWVWVLEFPKYLKHIEKKQRKQKRGK